MFMVKHIRQKIASFESIKTTSRVNVIKYHTLGTLLPELYFERLIYDFQPLAILKERSIIDVSRVLNTPLSLVDY